ncbi:hypothetical protein LTR36_005807 [Oleoguttula mirabilis]|uniref:RING-type domain-containing protein n=1 Tax=Oleoguttula mirabilis TaxID=1507867 RepID=A0AAV9JDR1_9PEZI|nr:hypothetical protein LTR36_005807 [Oleoguttula mirabilis]
MDLSDVIASSWVFLLHTLPSVLSSLPAILNSSLFICAGSVYATCYYLFGRETTVDAPTKGEPPSRTYFFEHCYKLPLATIYNDCSICWEPPTAPVELKPCGHIYCDACIKRWFNAGHKTCPYCMQTLWIERNSKAEIFCKLFVATTYLSVVMTIIVLLFARDLSRFFIVSASFGIMANLIILMQYLDAAKRWQGRWWRHLFDLPNGGTANTVTTSGAAIEMAVVTFAWLWWISAHVRV